MNKNALTTFWNNVEYYRISFKMHKKDVYVIERFGKNMTITTAAKIADNLGIELWQLFENVD
ncbi:hypothetical protein ACWODG_06910 [Enterococcus italicus]